MKNRRSIMAVLIISFTLICFWVAGTWQKTASLKAHEIKLKKMKKIEVPKLENIKPILKKILPPATKFKESKQKCSEECLVDYLSFHKGKKTGIITIFKLEGQWGPMVIMMGVNMDGEITDIELAYHTETPGCGSQIEKKPFLEQFKGKTVKDPIKIYQDLLEATDAVKGVDCITKATVSSRVIAKGVKRQLKLIVEHYLNGEEDAWR